MQGSNRLIELTDSLEAFVIPKIFLISKEQHEFVLTRQFLRSCTSIGANAREAKMAQSRRDYISKLSISRAECFESFVWLKNLHLAKLISDDERSLVFDILTQIHKILNRSITTWAWGKMQEHEIMEQ